MPLDQAARQYADTLFAMDLDRTNEERQARIRNITNDYARRNMLQSGGYLTAFAHAAVQNMEVMVRARMSALLAAYGRTGAALGEGEEGEILRELQAMCTPEPIVENMLHSCGTLIRTMPNVESAVRARIDRECSAVFARLRREVVRLRQERELDARRPAAEVPQGAETNERGDQRTVFVVHGRDERLRNAMFAFLRALDLRPLEWTEAIRLTGSAAPYVGQILESAFSHARAVVVLLSPDDEVRLRPALQGPNERAYELAFSPQARPNVLFEAGMALAFHPKRTVLVEIGQLRPFSDVAGRHSIRLDNSPGTRQALALRLRDAGCNVNLDGTDWNTEGDFTPS